ncbi:hypothetical protein NQ315_015493 [Exocentrus adspersus]|uniref:Uncharacterized protein n=1 Tax=Exocentrus adspersus TaxID=1586481 RepID=A0AAV8VNZ4_9CUCU|nr:hypothetical protein NQ315_015493 [Exocentrus adspersus]
MYHDQPLMEINIIVGFVSLANHAYNVNDYSILLLRSIIVSGGKRHISKQLNLLQQELALPSHKFAKYVMEIQRLMYSSICRWSNTIKANFNFSLFPITGQPVVDQNGYEYLPPNRVRFGDPLPPRPLKTTMAFATPSNLLIQGQLPQYQPTAPPAFGQRIPSLAYTDPAFYLILLMN